MRKLGQVLKETLSKIKVNLTMEDTQKIRPDIVLSRIRTNKSIFYLKKSFKLSVTQNPDGSYHLFNSKIGLNVFGHSISEALAEANNGFEFLYDFYHTNLNNPDLLKSVNDSPYPKLHAQEIIDYMDSIIERRETLVS